MDWGETALPFISQEDVDAARADAQQYAEPVTGGPALERITMIGFQTKTHSQMHAQAILHAALGQVMAKHPEVIAYWVAMDERYDSNDQESAILVARGLQRTVQLTMIEAGVSAAADSALVSPGDSFNKPQPEGEVG